MLYNNGVNIPLRIPELTINRRKKQLFISEKNNLNSPVKC